jgi:hypothetical protein
MVYNLANASNMSNIADLFKVSSQLSDGLFGPMILVVLFVVVFVQLKNYPTKPALAAAAFITAIAGILLLLMGIVTWPVLLITIVIAAIAAVLNWMS